MGYRNRPFNRRRAIQAGAGAAAFAAGAKFVSYPKRSFAQGTTLRLSTFANTDEQATIQTQLDAFASSTGITVNLESVPTDYPTALTTALGAGEAADVFWVDSLLAPDLYTRGYLLGMNDFLTEEELADYFPNLLAGYQYEGQTVGLPKDWSALAMWYNTALFEQAAVSAVPTTWDELRTALETVTNETGIPGLVVPDPARWLVFEYQAGGGILSEDMSEVVIGGEPTAAALEAWYGLYRDGIATTPADAGANDQGQAFGQELGSMAYEGNWNFGNYDLNFPDLPYGVAPLPAGPNGDRATFAFTVSYSIFAGTPNAEAAVELVKFLNGDDIMLNLTTSAGVMPSRSSLTEQWLAEFPERQLFVDAAEYARPWQLGPGGQLFFAAASSTLQELFAGGIDIEEATAQIRADAEENIQLQAAGTATPAS